KFRVGEEPEPFAFEINLGAEPWSLREVTAELEQAGEAARARAAAEASQVEQVLIGRLEDELSRRAEAGEQPLTRTAAVEVLHGDRTSRAAARTLLDRENGTRWCVVPDPAHRQRRLVVGLNQEWPRLGLAGSEPGASRGLFEGVNRAALAA